MRRYEVVFVLAPTLTEEEVEQQVATYAEAAEQVGAQIVSIDKWGKRELAYPIKKHKEGYYTILTIEETGSAAVNELERRFKVSDLVLRFLSIRVDEELKQAKKLEERRARRRARRRAAATAPGEKAEKTKGPVAEASQTATAEPEAEIAAETTAGSDEPAEVVAEATERIEE
ncbi:MAG: hypothetical protein Kow00109_03440 [Acidobacteriota bacterium]